jgi:hypothetical protein
VGHHVDQTAVEPEDGTLFAFAQPRGAYRNRVERRLDVGRRARDHLQDLGRRRLLLKGFGDLRMRLRQRIVLLLQLGEQSDVLNGDDGLVGEGPKQRDLALGERLHLTPRDRDRADRLVFPQHRHRHVTSVPERPLECWLKVGPLDDVGHV